MVHVSERLFVAGVEYVLVELIRQFFILYPQSGNEQLLMQVLVGQNVIIGDLRQKKIVNTGSQLLEISTYHIVFFVKTHDEFLETTKTTEN